jgi:hypothetical protein
MNRKEKAYVDKRARINQVNNTGVGRVVAITNDGRYTVELDGGRTLMVYSASGTYNLDDTVSIRYLSKDKRQAEIAGKTTRRLATERTQVWR